MSKAKLFEIKQLTNADLSTFTSLIHLFNMVFEEENSTIGSETNSLKLLNDNRFIALVTLAENEVVGGLTAYELPKYYSDTSEIFLYDLAVKSEYQRMGIGKGLIQSLKEYCIQRGIKEFFVMAHEEDEHAIEFYHATGGKSEKVVNFVYDVIKK
ncbi:MAG: GNAT family N-acetyltransferase [Chloroflexota bacterium]